MASDKEAIDFKVHVIRPQYCLHFNYIGSLKSADGNCSKDTRSRIGMAKKRMPELVPIWKARGINKDLKMKLLRTLVWTVLTYGAEGWTRTKTVEKRIESAKLWIYRRMLRFSWTEHRTDESSLTELIIIIIICAHRSNHNTRNVTQVYNN